MKRTRRRRFPFAASLLIAIAGSPVLAEPVPAGPPPALITGRVVDPSGAGIGGANAVCEASGRVLAVAATTFNGGFALSLPPGACTLSVTAAGFEPARREIAAGPGASETVVIPMQLAAQSLAITVTEGAPYQLSAVSSATRTSTPLVNVPQSVSVVTRELMRDQLMTSIGDVVRYVPGVTAIQGENNRDQVVIRGNSSTADFFVNGFRDDVQYYRDLYNLERVEALKGPNAMVFGRGGGGGVINRVTKEAGFTPLREIFLQGGSFRDRRVAMDVDQPFNDKAALRVNGVYENADSFRNFVGLERYGVTPTFTLLPSPNTKVVFSYENFQDRRTADRGISSWHDRPADVPIGTFFGNPADSRVRAGVNLGSAAIERQSGRFNIRNRTFVGDYDKFYRNYVPRAVDLSGLTVPLTAYDNATGRRNVFNQTDVTWAGSLGRLRHTLLWGGEAGFQRTRNFRNTGYFNGRDTVFTAPLSDPAVFAPIVFRQSATDADNRVRVNLAATWLQDQIELSRYFQAVVGLRFDNFDLRYFDQRARDQLRRIDNLVSPRAGFIVKPAAAASVYVNYSVSWLPSAGDQFASLTSVTQQVKPEKFTNIETGMKWDIRRDLSLTTAVYRLDRTNTRAVDPNDPTRIVQTGSQRTNGYEIGMNGGIVRRWTVAGGYAWQDATVTSATVAARAGARVAQVPRHSFSFWNNWQVRPRLSAGLGLLNRADMFAAIDNTVVLPGYTRADAALFYSFTDRTRLQVNVENLLNRRYYLNADGNSNVSPGSSRAVRIALVARF